MKILVTGATGLFGPILVDRLQADGHALRVLVHKTEPPAGVESFQGDMTDPASVAAACRGVDAVCHLATAKGAPDVFLTVNVGGLYHLLEQVRRMNPHPHLIHLSGDNTLPIFDHETKGPLGEDHPYLFGDNEYGLSKVLEETLAFQYIRKFGLPVTILRSSWIMEGMRSTLLCHPRRGGWKKYLDEKQRAMLEAGKPFRVVPHDKYGNPLKRHVIDPRDLASAFIHVMGNGAALGELYNISGPAPFDYRQLAAHLNRTDPQPTFDISTPDAFSFEIGIQKAQRIGYTPQYVIQDTVDWALSSTRT